MDDNINSKLDRGLIEWRCKCAVCHGDDSLTFAKFTKLLQIHQGHCWVARCFTKKHLQEKAMNLNITCSDKSVTHRGVQHSTLVTIFTRISTAALIYFSAPQVQHLFEGGTYLSLVPDKQNALHNKPGKKEKKLYVKEYSKYLCVMP